MTLLESLICKVTTITNIHFNYIYKSTLANYGTKEHNLLLPFTTLTTRVDTYTLT